MSLAHASHARMAPADELVPSRYAVRVGEIDVLVISDGVLPITTSTLATNADPAELAGWLGDNFLPHEVVDWPLNVVVVRSGDRTILVDAGLGLGSRTSRGRGKRRSDWRPPVSIWNP